MAPSRRVLLLLLLLPTFLFFSARKSTHHTPLHVSTFPTADLPLPETTAERVLLPTLALPSPSPTPLALPPLARLQRLPPSLSQVERAALPLVDAIASFSLSTLQTHISETFLGTPASTTDDLEREFTQLLPLPAYLSPPEDLAPQGRYEDAGVGKHGEGEGETEEEEEEPEHEVLLTLCAIASHESPWIVEWLTWHRLVGVERFLLFDIVPGGDPGKNGVSLMELLRPWREEGVVTLFQVSWPGGGVPSTWHLSLLDLFATHVLPRTAWAAHWDVDEFLLPPAPAMLGANAGLTRIPHSSGKGATQMWSYAVHTRLMHLDEAACVPVWPASFANVGWKSINGDGNGEELEGGEEEDQTEVGTEWKTVTGNNVHRFSSSERRWGKIFIHAEYEEGIAYWGGIHNCIPDWGFKILSPYTGLEMPEYSGTGVPEIERGMSLIHFGQRTLSNCLSKLSVLSNSTSTNWRLTAGSEGCTNSHIPLSSLAAHLSSGNLVEDPVGRESWEGRMTRKVLEEWWVGGKGWNWGGEGKGKKGKEKKKEKGVGVVRIQLEVLRFGPLPGPLPVPA